ncbi:hypothetical protein A5707_13630 [Mycobacterium kyorinense]|uniref:Low molecular weight antigen MTB12-like C-terminal domain-containing protein n=1 Tax=Mycobacterium kyorinense TaxID=487514 RepID=A0A1A2ZN22_9MYCO|nr:hypothetical protein A5707_13630 [Mycobacterium kyorinense]
MAALSAATIVAAFGLSGCSGHEPAAGTSSSSAAASTPASAVLTSEARPVAPVPPPEALTDVLYRLADPGVPGSDKLDLVEGATPDDAAALDKFATALLDGGYAPVTFEARDIAWSDRNPADVVATVDVSTPHPGPAGFSFPMEFKPYQGGWQLSQRTAEMLLTFSGTAPGLSASPTP